MGGGGNTFYWYWLFLVLILQMISFLQSYPVVYALTVRPYLKNFQRGPKLFQGVLIVFLEETYSTCDSQGVVRTPCPHSSLDPPMSNSKYKRASTCDLQQGGILTSVDSGEPVQPPFKLRHSKWCSVRILTLKIYSSDDQTASMRRLI